MGNLESKQSVPTKTLVFTGVLVGVLARVGIYFITKKNDVEYHEEFCIDTSKSLISSVKLSQIELTKKYNKSTSLVKENKNRLSQIKSTHKKDSNSLLNDIDIRLEDYPRIYMRSFHTFNTKGQATDIRSQFRIMQWNGLGKNLSSAVKCAYNSEPLIHDWENFRKWRVLEELIQYHCDVICLQEADFYEDIRPYLHEMGYKSIFCPKSAYAVNSLDADGCAIFYDAKIFQFLKLYADLININGEFESHVYIIIQLRHKFTKKIITVVCAHLKSGRDEEKNFENKRFNQTKQILTTLKELLVATTSLEEVKNSAVVICGDFNGDYKESFYELIMNDYLLKLHDSHPKSPINKNTYTVDYIFYTSNSLEILGQLSQKRNGFLPNLSYPSDHLSLVCEFKVK